MTISVMVAEFSKLIVAGIFGGIAAALFGAFFSFRRFRKEEIWKQRRDTYKDLIAGMGHIRSQASEVSDYYASKGQAGKEDLNVSETLTSLQKIYETGDYIISAKAYVALKALLGEFDSPNLGPPDCGDVIYGSTEAALLIIRREAAKYLIPKTSFEYWRQRLQFWSKR